MPYPTSIHVMPLAPALTPLTLRTISPLHSTHTHTHTHTPCTRPFVQLFSRHLASTHRIQFFLGLGGLFDDGFCSALCLHLLFCKKAHFSSYVTIPSALFLLLLLLSHFFSPFFCCIFPLPLFYLDDDNEHSVSLMYVPNHPSTALSLLHLPSFKSKTRCRFSNAIPQFAIRALPETDTRSRRSRPTFF